MTLMACHSTMHNAPGYARPLTSQTSTASPPPGVKVGSPPPRTSDGRGASRIRLLPGRAQIDIGELWRPEVHDLSATGGSLVLPPGAQIGAEGALEATIHLPGERAFQTSFRVMRTQPEEDGLRVGGRFALEPQALRALSRFVVREHVGRRLDLDRLENAGESVRTADRAAMAKLLSAEAQACGTPLSIFAGNRLTPLSLRLRHVPLEGQRDLEAELVRPALHCGEDEELICGLEYTFVARGRSSLSMFRGVVRAAHGDCIRIGFPDSLVQTGFRSSHRTPLPRGEALPISFLVPWEEDRLSLWAVEVSARGLAFDLDSDAHTIFPGDRLRDLIVQLPDGPLAAQAVLRGFCQPRGSVVRCGVEIVEFASDEDRRRWHAFVFAQGHPSLQRTDVDLDDVWGVFESSSYVDKWIAAGRAEQIHADFSRDWQASAANVRELLLLRHQRSPIGTIAANRIYPRTWLMHSLAVDKQQRQRDERARFLTLARELYSGIMYSLQHITGARYFLSYFEESKNWNQRLYRDFSRDYVRREDQLYENFLVLRRNGAGLPVAGPLSDAEIVPASSADLESLCRHAEVAISPLLVDALSLDAQGLRHDAFQADFAADGVIRRRDVFLACEGGRPLLAAICESGGSGINIFGLMNLTWTIPLGGEAPRAETMRALVDTVSAHYQARGVQDFLFLEGRPERQACLEQAGLQLVSSGIRWLARTDVLPAWLGYVENELRAVELGRDTRVVVASESGHVASGRRHVA